MSILKDFKVWSALKKKEIEIQSLAIGLNSTVDFTADKHIVMLDFDIKDPNSVIESIQETQLFWHLGDAHIIRTRNGFHAYFFTSIVPYARLKQIIDYSCHVDPMYKFISKYYDHKTLRVAGKYKDKDLTFFKLIKSPHKPNYDVDLGLIKKSEFETMSNVRLH